MELIKIVLMGLIKIMLMGLIKIVLLKLIKIVLLELIKIQSKITKPFLTNKKQIIKVEFNFRKITV